MSTAPNTAPPARTDVLVVGAGLMGAATAWHLARRGVDVTVLEQHEPATSWGSSHGSARIVRRAYPQDDYVRLAGEAFELWRELETETGRDLVTILGGLDHGARRDPETIADTLTRAGVEHTLMSPEEAGERWPGMRFDGPVLHHPQAGTLDSESAVHGFLEVATRHGAQVLDGVAVTALEPDDDGVTVGTTHGEVRARRVVVAAGAWTARLLGALVPLPPLDVTEHRVFHFPRRDESVVWPVTIHRADLDLYHLPGGRDAGPADARKIAQHVGRPADPDHRDPEVDHLARTQMLDYLEHWLPGLAPEPFAETTCLYTRTPTEDFVIDRRGPVVVTAACSGHGAKHAPVVGRLAAELASDDSSVALARFALDAHLSSV